MHLSNENFHIYEQLISTLHAEVSKKTPFVLVIDGMCGSGKTTLAEYLCRHFTAAVIHMDNFFLPFERKTPERLSEPGGNIDYERFCEIMLPTLKKREPFSYTAYNCQTASYDREIWIPSCDLIIVEGSYSMHEKFGNYYDASLFLTVEKEEQLSRLKARCKDDKKFSRFKTEWIPMELHYHTAQCTQSRAQFVIDTSQK